MGVVCVDAVFAHRACLSLALIRYASARLLKTLAREAVEADEGTSATAALAPAPPAAGGADAGGAPAAGGAQEEEIPPAPVERFGDGDEDEDGPPPPPPMTVEQVEEFFLSTVERLTSPEEREDIKSKVCARHRHA